MPKFFVNIVFPGLLLLLSCDMFKTRYEEIPPEFPETISVLAEIDTQWSIRTLDGRELSLSSFRGKRLFINLWATWCGPCLAELPNLQKLYDSQRADTGLVFLFISDEPDATVRSFVSEAKYTLPFYLCEGAKPKVFDTGAYPSTFIANARGEIVYKLPMTAKWDHPSVIDFLHRI